MDNTDINTNNSSTNVSQVQVPEAKPLDQPPKLRFKLKWKRLSLVIIVLLFIFIVILQGYFLLSKQSNFMSQSPSPSPATKANTPTPTPKNYVETTNYINSKYGFQITYPLKGKVLTEKGIVDGACGNAIREISDQSIKEGIIFDNFFKVVIVDWEKSINDYIKEKNATNLYLLTTIATSSAEADEAFMIKLKDDWQSYTTSLKPPLSDTINIYKKGNKIFLLNAVSDNINVNGCISPNASFAREFWGLKNFKFVVLTGQPDLITNWKAYTMPIEKLTIRFPPDWTLTKQSFPEDPTAESVTFTSPSNFQLSFTTGGQYKGECNADCQSHNIPNILLDTLNFYSKPLYVVVHGLKDDSSFGSARTLFSVIESKSCFDNLCGGYTGKRGRIVVIQGGFIKQIDKKTSSYTNISANDFVNSADVKTAIKMLKNIHY